MKSQAARISPRSPIALVAMLMLVLVSGMAFAAGGGHGGGGHMGGGFGGGHFGAPHGSGGFNGHSGFGHFGHRDFDGGAILVPYPYAPYGFYDYYGPYGYGAYYPYCDPNTPYYNPSYC
jgi:hypothetical protein